jgi:hypothetical protein
MLEELASGRLQQRATAFQRADKTVLPPGRRKYYIIARERAHRLSAKAPETAESALSTQEQEVALAPQPPPRSPKTPVERALAFRKV